MRCRLHRDVYAARTSYAVRSSGRSAARCSPPGCCRSRSSLTSASQSRPSHAPRRCAPAATSASHICTGIGLTPATSARGLGSPLPHLRRDCASPLPRLRRDWAHPCHLCAGTVPHPCHICAGTGLTPATSAPGLGSLLPRLRRDWAHSCHVCAGMWLTLVASAPEPATEPRVPERVLRANHR